MKVAIGADHGGYYLKSDMTKLLESLGHDVVDKGAYEFDAEDDFPDFAAPVAAAVQSGETERGIVICGSGVGATIAANKYPGVRAGLCHDTYSAGQGVQHDDMNVLCMGARVVGVALAEELVKSFIAANLEASEPRFQRRLDKVAAIENDQISRS
ncbi:MAG: ribose 5-phosphate isomerase B [Dehalococcoidia bacterium]|jgi:ribose 5-phosphate isomerase B|nr:ribose 5-phosphate isomerase B [Chloroflexota bacterium]MDP6057020.1 ribose 5-phosphate isomerase B [Dehalococcoidia bacterium]MDP7261112.1 ribose 5-phosphate isomerase B [Dehalococcoidia bacterium]MDP7486358.1 ribose 5-phosphate isomerase B [Dehalococcoidia bacterium]|tara:strand:+ start:3143 stop:3607 length:465 start_codon:yes stop_codon:yes gene_type:complete